MATNRDPVLLVENHAETRAAVRRLLEFRGHLVVEASDGVEAWEYLERGGRASAIVLDLDMPRMDGRLFRTKQLNDAQLATIPVIVFTGLSGEGLIDGACVIRKTDPDALLDLVDHTATPALVDK
jgi:CheY-like chemotaxis protein